MLNTYSTTKEDTPSEVCFFKEPEAIFTFNLRDLIDHITDGSLRQFLLLRL
jgi:hypothetical protein